MKKRDDNARLAMFHWFRALFESFCGLFKRREAGTEESISTMPAERLAKKMQEYFDNNNDG